MMGPRRRHAARGTVPENCRHAATISGERRPGGHTPEERKVEKSRAPRLAIALTLAGAALADVALTDAGAQGQTLPTFSARALLDAHNSARAQVGSPPLAWSSGLAADAKQWADRLLAEHAFAHQPNDAHGENLFAISGGTAAPAEVVRTWVAERGDYDPRTNTCSGVCGHYTQVVWRTTREVGCGMAFDGYRQVWVCEYEPPGNVVGFRPY
jgi:uncharacterized protein YkwD